MMTSRVKCFTVHWVARLCGQESKADKCHSEKRPLQYLMLPRTEKMQLGSSGTAFSYNREEESVHDPAPCRVSPSQPAGPLRAQEGNVTT